MGIRSIAYAVPSVMHTAADISSFTGADETFIAEKVGVQKRYVLGPDETGVSLAIKACQNLFERNPELPELVEVVVCITQNPDRRIPHNAALISSGLDLGTDIASFDISLGCSGYIHGLDIVDGFMRSAGFKNAILVTCDPYSRIIAKEDRDTNCVFGDAATATWMSADDLGSVCKATVYGSDGSKGDAIQVPRGGAEFPLLALENDDVPIYSRDELRLHMSGRPVFNFVMSTVAQSILQCVEKADISMEDIDHAALHQGSVYMLDALGRKISVSPEKLLKNIHDYGNTVSSTVPMLLADLESKSLLKGSTVLVSGFGVGLSWGTKVLQFS